MKYENDCQLPNIVKTKPHSAFEVENIYEYIKDKRVIIEPSKPSEGNIVDFIEDEWMPIKPIQISRNK